MTIKKFEEGEIVEGIVKGYGEKGDLLVEPFNTEKIVIINQYPDKKIDEDIDNYAFVYDEVKVKIVKDFENYSFGELLEITNKNNNAKYTILLDLAELLDMDKKHLTTTGWDGKRIPDGITKKGVFYLVKKVQWLKRRNAYLENVKENKNYYERDFEE